MVEESILPLLLRYRWCKDLRLCIGCEKSLENEGVLCSSCQIFSYCSHQCLQKDTAQHKPVCETILFVKGVESVVPEHVEKKVTRLMYRAKLLDSEGNFISPAVIRDAYLIKGSDLFSRYLPTLLSESESATHESGGQRQSQKYVNATLALNINGNATAAPEVFQEGTSFKTRQGGSQHPASKLEHGHFGRPINVRGQRTLNVKSDHETSGTCQENLLKEGQTGHKQPQNSQSEPTSDDPEPTSDSKGRTEDCEKNKCKSSSKTKSSTYKDNHIANDNPCSSYNVCSSDSQSSRKSVSGNEAKTNQSTDSFGLGWWGKNKDKSSKEHSKGKIHGGNSTHKGSSPNSHDKESVPTNDTGINAHTSSKKPGSSQARKQTESDTFGSGWWQGGVSSHAMMATSTPAKHQTAPCTAAGQSNSENRQRRDGVRSTSGNSALSSNVLSSSTLSNSTSNNNTSNKDSISNSSCTRSSHNSSTASSGTSTNPESNDFGAGWWKHRGVKKVKRKVNSTNSKADQVSSKQNNTDFFVANKCQDVVPYRTFVTPEHSARCAKAASHIDSRLIEHEAICGRILVMALIAVPGLWRASLGGSHISLVVEIVNRIPRHVPAVIVRDIFGHTAPVFLNTTESATCNIVNTKGILSLPVSECLKPGNFIVLLAVKWEQSVTGELIIVMTDMTKVEFVFV